MSTKSLSRSLVERGNDETTKTKIRKERRSERRKVKNFCREAAQMECLEDLGLDPISGPSVKGPGFEIKFTALSRWFDSRVGKSWDESWRWACKNLDEALVRQIHHFVDLGEEQYGFLSLDGSWVSYASWYVDEEGILRESDYSWRKRPKRNWATDKEIREWLGHRRVLKVGEKFFWTNPDVWISPRRLVGRWDWASKGLQWETCETAVAHRQGEPLGQEDLEFMGRIRPIDLERQVFYQKSDAFIRRRS